MRRLLAVLAIALFLSACGRSNNAAPSNDSCGEANTAKPTDNGQPAGTSKSRSAEEVAKLYAAAFEALDGDRVATLFQPAEQAEARKMYNEFILKGYKLRGSKVKCRARVVEKGDDVHLETSVVEVKDGKEGAPRPNRLRLIKLDGVWWLKNE